MPPFKANLLRLLAGRQRRLIALDALLGTCVLAESTVLYGRHWPVLAALLASRALAISLLDNVWHYGTSLASGTYAHSLSLPAPFSLALLHLNFHHTHHVYPHVPWRRLPVIAAEAGHGWVGRFWPALWRQFRGPISAEALRAAPPSGSALFA